MHFIKGMSMDDFKEERPSDFEPIGEILGRALQNCRRDPDIELTRIWEHWRHIVGETIAENARPAAFKGRLLIVHVNSSVWLQQLQFAKADIIRKTNAEFGKILLDDIKFKIGVLE